MNKKSRKPAKKRSRPLKRKTPAEGPRMLFRTMERHQLAIERELEGREFESAQEANAFIDRLLSESDGKLPPPQPAPPLDRAQDLMFEAWELDDPLARICFALKALHICRDCADAYSLLAEEAALDEEQARDLYAEGVAAAERALGPQFFEENAGEFWGVIRSRPYMRARNGLAQVLWALGQRDEAISHFKDLLRLNPGDNQGIRYVLVSHLFQMNRDDDLAALFQQYPDDYGVDFFYSRALHEFRRSGDCEEARELLARAVERNKYVPLYLLGRKQLPQNTPEAYAVGTYEEAQCYAERGISAWNATPAALQWLDDYLETRYRRKPASA
jgi:tetratricopeptide (TPR) repeat protein